MKREYYYVRRELKDTGEILLTSYQTQSQAEEHGGPGNSRVKPETCEFEIGRKSMILEEDGSIVFTDDDPQFVLRSSCIQPTKKKPTGRKDLFCILVTKDGEKWSVLPGSEVVGYGPVNTMMRRIMAEESDYVKALAVEILEDEAWGVKKTGGMVQAKEFLI